MGGGTSRGNQWLSRFAKRVRYVEFAAIGIHVTARGTTAKLLLPVTVFSTDFTVAAS